MMSSTAGLPNRSDKAREGAACEDACRRSLELMMGNQAVAHGALKAGVRLVSGYPGTPSTEVLETVSALVRAWAAANEPGGRGEVHVEWSVNEKAALEVAAGAAMCGARSLVTMKQVGLNVASDPLMTLSYLGCKGGLVLYVADDPGPISSQTEQDTRQFAAFAKIPILDPSTPEDAYRMVGDAFELSERIGLPVILRSTTRICHGSAAIEPTSGYEAHPIEGFERNSRWVTFPPLAHRVHAGLAAREAAIVDLLSTYWGNEIREFGGRGASGEQEVDDERDGDDRRSPRLGIIASGISWAYLLDVLDNCVGQGDRGTCSLTLPPLRLARFATAYPFPDDFAARVLDNLDSVLVFEELEPVVERELLRLCGARKLPVTIHGKLTGDTSLAGENSIDTIRQQLAAFLGAAGQGGNLPVPSGVDGVTGDGSLSRFENSDKGPSPVPPAPVAPAPPPLPARPPVLCAGCPHRASFLAVKQALGKQPATWGGDIGCYTLGNTWPLDVVDTCVCMGAGFTVPQGMAWAEPGVKHLGFVGDSTFFASGITGVVNAVYNQTDVTLFVLDNATTAMTGAQQHPGTGVRMSFDATPADATNALSIPAVLRACGVGHVAVCDPFDFEAAIATAREAIDYPRVSAVVFQSPCITLTKPQAPPTCDEDACTMCRACINKLGCPALTVRDGRIAIEASLCTGCGLCLNFCRFGALSLATTLPSGPSLSHTDSSEIAGQALGDKGDGCQGARPPDTLVDKDGVA